MRLRGGALLAAAACGLWAGCEFWDNFLTSHRVNHVDLVLDLRDAWTNDSLKGVSCRDDSLDIQGTSGPDGLLTFPGAALRTYHFVCSHGDYHDRRIEVEARTDAPQHVVKLARLGGDQKWYYDVRGRALDLSVAENPLRAPDTLQLSATPDTTDIFRFTWTSKRFPGSPDLRDFPTIAMPLGALPAGDPDTLVDTITLTVHAVGDLAAFADSASYLIGTRDTVVTWVRNQPPTLHLVNTINPVRKVGCPRENNSDSLVLNYKAADPDGRCVRVQFRSDLVGSSLGILDTSRACVAGNDVMSLPLHNPFPRVPGVPLEQYQERENRLTIRVWDDNGFSRDTVIKFNTKPNLSPYLADIVKLDSLGRHFPYSSVKFRANGGDIDSPIDSITIDWGDGSYWWRKDYPTNPAQGRVTEDPDHFFGGPGTFTVSLTVKDQCGATKVHFIDVQVDTNQKPFLKLTDKGFFGNPGMFKLGILAYDPDEIAGLPDSLVLVHIDWGDSSFTNLNGREKEGSPPDFPRGLFSRDIIHQYIKPPTRPDGKYELTVQVEDELGDQETVVKYVDPTSSPDPEAGAAGPP